MEADTYCLQCPLPRQRRSASAGLRWCGALVRRDPERIRYDQDQRPAKRKAAVGSEEPIEGKETKARCPFQYGQVRLICSKKWNLREAVCISSLPYVHVSTRRFDRTAWLGISDSNFDVQSENSSLLRNCKGSDLRKAVQTLAPPRRIIFSAGAGLLAVRTLLRRAAHPAGQVL